MLEMFAHPFMQRAAIAGVLVAFLASFYGVFVVQRGMSFLGDGLAHAAFGGVALGLLLNVEPLWIAVPATLAVASGIVWVQNRAKLAGDVAVGIFFSVSMALGIVFLSMRETFSTDATSYLFGSILSVSASDVWMVAAMSSLSLLTWPFWGKWAYATFDRELARADRIPAPRHDYYLCLCVAATVVLAVKIVGVVLVASFLVIPAAAARLLSRTFFSMAVLAVMIGILSSLAGLMVSYHFDWPSGAAIVLTQAAIFFAAMVKQPSK